MPRTRTLAEMRLDARQLADKENDDHVQTTELTRWVNQSLAELWSLIFTGDPDRYMQITDITTVSNTFRYDLPTDFLSVRSVERMSDTLANIGVRIRPFRLQERSHYVEPWWNGLRYTNVRYRVDGGGVDGTEARLHFTPDPGNNTYRLYYAQQPQDLVADGDVFDGVAGWEEWIALDCAIKMLVKEESDPTALQMRQQRVELRINHMATLRDTGGEGTIADVKRYRRRRRYPRAR